MIITKKDMIGKIKRRKKEAFYASYKNSGDGSCWSSEYETTISKEELIALLKDEDSIISYYSLNNDGNIYTITIETEEVSGEYTIGYTSYVVYL